MWRRRRSTKHGWLVTDDLVVIDLENLVALTKVDDIYRLDRELDNLRALGLISQGFHPNEKSADITPTSLALQMHAKCQGWIASPLEFYGVAGDDDAS